MPSESSGACTRTSCRFHLEQRSRGEHRVVPKADCALLVANEGPHTIERVAEFTGMGRERIRQLESSALHKLAQSELFRALLHDYGITPTSNRRRRTRTGG